MPSNTFERLRDRIKQGDIIAVRKFLDADGDPNLQNEKGECLLSIAAFSGQTSLVELLLQHGALPNGHSKYEWTPLYLACINGHVRTVQSLLKNGASNDVYMNGKPILYWLSLNGDRERIIEILSSLTHHSSGTPNGAP